MNDKEIEMLAVHLGHDVRTHKEWYRLAHSTIELSKVSQLLLAVESGDISKWKGKNLRDISIEDLPPIEDLELGCAGDQNTEEADGYEESDDVQSCIPEVDLLQQGVSTSKLHVKRVKDDCKRVKRRRGCDSTSDDEEDEEDEDTEKRPKVHERCRRRPWTVEENRALSILFRKQLKGTSKCIRNADLIKAKRQFPCLDSRTLPQIRAKLNNIMLGKSL